MHRILGALLLALLLGGCATTGSPDIGNAYGITPFAAWKSIETEHFRFHFPEEMQPIAQYLAVEAESIYSFLSPQLYWEPSKKTHVTLVDSSDQANGWTNPAWRPGILLYSAMPDSASSLTYYDRWYRMLFLHEYTHFLNIDATRSFYTPLRWLFGDIIIPNALQQSWILEGLAVYYETRHMKGGRGRSTYWDMAVRASVMDKSLDTHQGVTLDRMTGSTPYFPWGEMWYLYGYELTRRAALANTTGTTQDKDTLLKTPEDSLGIISWRSSGRFPYFISGNSQNVTGRTWEEHWGDWVAEAREHAEKQLEQIRKNPVTSWTWLTQPDLKNHRETTSVAASRDSHWLAYTQRSSDDWTRLWLRDLKTGEERKLMDTYGTQQLAFAQDSKTLWFHSIERHHNYNLYGDIYAYDLERDKMRRLTWGVRARDPDLSPDLSQVVYAKQLPGRVSLMVAPVKWQEGTPEVGEERVLWSAGFADRAATPRFTADGKSVVFTIHKDGKFSEELVMIDAAATAGQPTELVANGSFCRFPALGPDGSLYYVSDETGLDNLYRLNWKSGQFEHKPQQLSNFLTGLRSPAVAGSGRVFGAGFSSTGWELVEADIQAPVAATAKIEPPLAPEPSEHSAAAPAAKAESVATDYNVWPSILPRNWNPYFLYSGIFQFGAQARGNDALDLNQYGLMAGYTTQTLRPDWAIGYANRNLGATFSITLMDATTGWSYFADGTLLPPMNTYTRSSSLSAAVSFPVQFLFSTLTPYLAFSASQDNIARPGASDYISRGLYVPYLDAGLSFSYGRSSSLGITTEQGRDISLASRGALYSGVPYWKLYASETEYFRLIGKHTILSPSIKALWSPNAPHVSYVGARVSGASTYTGPSVVNFGPLGSSSLTQLALRGYPGISLYSQLAATGSLDFRFPIAPIFRGIWGSLPLFFSQVRGLLFIESAFFPLGDAGGPWVLPTAGAGMGIDTEWLLNIPLQFSFQFSYGFRSDWGGAPQMIFNIGSDIL